MTAPAVNSLNDIRDYIIYCSDDLNLAAKACGNIGRFIKSLSDVPFIGQIVEYEKVKGKNIRRVTFNKKYNIYYRVNEQAQIVYIPKIVNGEQSTDRQLFGL